MPVSENTTTLTGSQSLLEPTDTAPDEASVRVIISPHPFSRQKEIRSAPALRPLQEVLDELGYAQRRGTKYAVCIDGVPVPEDQWAWETPQANSEVTVNCVPLGGGGGDGKSIAQILVGVVLIAATIFQPELFPIVLGFGIEVSASAAFALGVGLVLSGVVGLITPKPSLPNFGAGFSPEASTKLINTVTGTQNRANPFGAIPRVLGTHRLFPTLGAVPYTEIVGNEQYLTMLFCLGYGRLDISSIRIGQTAIGSFENVTYNTFEGTTATPNLTIYTNDVDEDRFDILLTNAAGWQSRTTVDGTERISVDVVFPQGVVKFNTQGQRISTTVQVDVEYKLTSEPTVWTSAGSITVTDKTSSTLRRTLKWSVTAGEYDVRLQRVTADATSDQQFDTVRWVVLRTFKLTSPINTTKKLAYIEVRIQASNQLNGVIEQLNCLCSSYLQTYNGSSWVSAISNNPAWCYTSPLLDEANANAIATSRIDASTLKDWADWCDTNGFTYNRIHDTRATVFAIMQEVAAAGRGQFHISDGLYSIVRDIAQTTPIQHITPRNSFNYRGEKKIQNSPHALRIPFVNENIDYQQDERIVYDDGYDAGTATILEQIEFAGVTDPDQIWKLGRYHIAQVRLRPEIHKVDMDMEYLVCTPGDLVELVHDVPKFGLGSARITQVDVDGSSNVTDIHFDEVWTHIFGDTHAVRIRKSDGTSLLENVNTNVGTNKSVTFTTPIPAANPLPEVGDIVMFGVQGSTTVSMLVKAVTPGPNLTATLTLVQEAPGVLTADSGAIPAFDTQITQPPRLEQRTPPTPEVGSVRSDESVLVRDADGSLRSQLVIGLYLPSGTGSYGPTFYQAQFRVNGSAGPYTSLPLVSTDENEVIVGNVTDGETYEYRVRTVTNAGLASLWTSPATHTVTGKSNPPPDVTTFMVQRQPDGTREFEWTLASPPLDLAGYKIKWKLGTGHAWADLAELHSGLLQASKFETNQLAAGEYTIGIKAVDTSGNESTNAKIITSNIGNPRLAGALLQVNCRALGWPGTKTSCYVNDMDDLIANDTKTWADFAIDGITWAGWTSWVRSAADPIQYDHSTIDLGAVLTFTLLVTASGNGNFTITEAHSDDDITYSSYAAISGQITARYIKVRVSCTTADSSVPYFENIIIIPDAAALVEDIQDVDTSTLSGTTGDRRFALEKNFAIITSVGLAFQNVGAGWTWEVIDKSVSLGPRVKMYDSGGTLADATVDAVIRGVESNT